MITKQCSLMEKHQPHEWHDGPFRRWCKGRERKAKEKK